MVTFTVVAVPPGTVQVSVRESLLTVNG